MKTNWNTTIPVGVRLIEKLKINKKTGCWDWCGANDGKGYGVVGVGSSRKQGTITLKAYRVSYAVFIGKIPRGKHIMHTCDNPGCINPMHLVLGSHYENMNDMGFKKRDKNSKKMKCPKGHPYSKRNTYSGLRVDRFGKTKGYRRCNECLKARRKKHLPWKREVYRLRRLGLMPVPRWMIKNGFKVKKLKE